MHSGEMVEARRFDPRSVWMQRTWFLYLSARTGALTTGEEEKEAERETRTAADHPKWRELLELVLCHHGEDSNCSEKLQVLWYLKCFPFFQSLSRLLQFLDLCRALANSSEHSMWRKYLIFKTLLGLGRQGGPWRAGPPRHVFLRGPPAQLLT